MIRPMTPADVDAVLAIEQAVQHYPWTRGNFTDALASGYLCWVDSAELVDGHPEQAIEIRAYAILMPVVDEAELLTIGVAATQQRKGVGRRMLNEILAMARVNGIRLVHLEVRAGNAPALALYRSAGFVQIGLRRGYYRDENGAEDAITMACELTGETNG